MMAFDKTPLSEGDRAIIREIAREVLNEGKNEMDRKIQVHQLQCNYKRQTRIVGVLSGIIGSVATMSLRWLLSPKG